MSHNKYQPPYTITPAIVNLVAEIGETIGRYTVLAEQNLTPQLRRENRIRTIQASLAIENNTLTPTNRVAANRNTASPIKAEN